MHLMGRESSSHCLLLDCQVSSNLWHDQRWPENRGTEDHSTWTLSWFLGQVSPDIAALCTGNSPQGT